MPHGSCRWGVGGEAGQEGRHSDEGKERGEKAPAGGASDRVWEGRYTQYQDLQYSLGGRRGRGEVVCRQGRRGEMGVLQVERGAGGDALTWRGGGGQGE